MGKGEVESDKSREFGNKKVEDFFVLTKKTRTGPGVPRLPHPTL